MQTLPGYLSDLRLSPYTTGMFMDKKVAARHGFKLQKLEKPIAVRNLDRTNNSREVITY